MMMTPLLMWLAVAATLHFAVPEDTATCSCCQTTILSNLCRGGRTTPRPDCPCCPVCAQQAGETCDLVSLPCDSELRLRCDNSTCQGTAGLTFVNTTINSTTLEWQNGTWKAVLYDIRFNNTWMTHDVSTESTSAILEGLRPNTTYFIALKNDTGFESEIIMVITKEACDVNGTWLAEGDSITEGCEKRCTCQAGGELKCDPRCTHLPGSVTDPLCDETPAVNDTCCVEYACAQSKDSGSAPQVIVTGRAPSNISIAWDDFKPPSYERGYIVEVRASDLDGNWTQFSANNTNMMTIDNLTPNTRYEVRVTIWDERDKLISASEYLNVTTTDGCVKNNRTYRTDEEWMEGCEFRCVCRQNYSIECSKRCPWPLHRMDEAPADPKCTLIPDKDSCCASLHCEKGPDPSVAAVHCLTPAPDHSDHCLSNCSSHSDCPIQNEFCCPTACGATVCTNATASAANQSDPCLNIICGPQAKCQLFADVPKCQCAEGTSGDPNDYTRGCSAVTPSVIGAGCSLKNQTYLPGEHFFDGCDYRCLCNLNAEIECEPRCAAPAESINDPTCHIMTDPSDSCCNITVCGSHPVKEQSKKIKIDSIEGCFYKNKTYQRLEQIQEGCSMKCICQGHGSISCVPRCPPTSAVVSGCVSLPDPIDSCCNVTICNITGLAEDLKDATFNSTEKEIETTTNQIMSSTTQEVPSNTIVGGVTEPLVTESSTMLKQTANETFVAKEPLFPAPTKDAFNELGPTDAAKKVESTAKAIRTAVDVTATPMPFEETVDTTTAIDVTTSKSSGDDDNLNHLARELSPMSTETETAATDGTVIGNVTAPTENITTEFSTVMTTDITLLASTLTPSQETTATSTLLLSNVFVEKKERARKLEDKVTGLKNDVHCELNGHQMSVGQELVDGCFRLCHCLEGGRTLCTVISCPYSQPSQVSGCLQWQYDHDFEPKPGNCCAESTCIAKLPVQTGTPCEYNGKHYSNLEPIPPSLAPSCDMECRCMDGNVSCESRCPPVAPDPPTTLACLPQMAEIALLPDKCCKGWRCPDLLTGNHEEEFDSFQGSFLPGRGIHITSPNEKKPISNPFLVTAPHEEETDAIFKGGLLPSAQPVEEPSLSGFTLNSFPMSPGFAQKECQTTDGPRVVGEQWEESPGCRSRRCACIQLSNGSTNVECTGGCYPIERYLKPTSSCPLPVLVTPDDPCFCPYVMCNKTDSGSSIQNMTAVALNSTTVRVSLVIPKLYVGLYGQVEVLYTDDATQTNTSTWNKEVFSHRNDMFAEAQMQHELTSLLPDTTYYVRANVILSGNSNTATSSVITVRTLPLQVSTTLATTLPSRITVDPSFNITDKQPTSVRLSWRPLTEQEKKVVDGVQLKYRVQGDETWGLTTVIHRDVTSYTLRDLQPNTAYEVDMLLLPVDGITTDIETTNPVMFQTNLIHDDYAFDITLTVDKVLVNSANLHWSGVPFPMHKYVHLYIIKYKTDTQTDSQTIYKHPKVEQVSLDGLKPGNRYHIWMEAILSNGDVRKSNIIEITTKPGVLLKTPDKGDPEKRLETTRPDNRPSTEASGNNSYYEALIAVAVVAAICVLGFVALLILLLRRQSGSTTPPTNSHKSQSAYENPTYKPSYDGEMENGKTTPA